jgi:serine/threonine-protein kinase
VLEKVQQGDWRPARKAKRSVPRALDAVCRKAMALNAADRYATALEVAADVEHWLADDPVSAWREPWPTRAGRWVRRHRTMVAAGVAASFVALLLGGAGLMWQQRVLAQQRQEQARQRLVQDYKRATAETALERVNDFQARGQWAEARTALEQAGAGLSATASEELQQRVGEARRNLELVASLDDVRQRSLNGFGETTNRIDPAETDRHYEQAFWGAQIAPGTDPEAVANRVKESPVREVLVATLDDWARVASGSRRAWALAVARRADPNPWRDRLRDPAVWADEKLLAKLASEAPAEQVGPGLVAAIGGRLSAAGEGVELLRAALAHWPSNFWLNYYLASVLERKGRIAEAEGFHRVALALRPDIAATYYNLATLLESQGKNDEAYRLFLNAFECYPKPPGMKPEVCWAWSVGKFGSVWQRLGKLDDAATLCVKAIQADSSADIGYTSLLWVLERQGKREEAFSWYRKAFDANSKDPNARIRIAEALARRGKLEEAISVYRSIAEFPDLWNAHNDMGKDLLNLGRLDEAEVSFLKAIKIDPKHSFPRNNLGVVFERRGNWKEAEANYRKAVELDGNNIVARRNLAGALLAEKRYDEADEECEKLLARLAKSDPRRPQAEGYLRRAQLGKRLPAVLRGQDHPVNAVEGLAFAEMFYRDKNHVLAARLSADAFAAEPKLADNLGAFYRYNAARYAALAGCGNGEGAAGLKDEERARLRIQARTWLRADLAEWSKRIKGSAAEQNDALKQLRHWLEGEDFSGVRESTGLARLPEAERKEWQTLWADVKAVLTNPPSK